MSTKYVLSTLPVSYLAFVVTIIWKVQ